WFVSPGTSAIAICRRNWWPVWMAERCESATTMSSPGWSTAWADTATPSWPPSIPKAGPMQRRAAGNIITSMTRRMITLMADAALYDLMTWMSPSWPIGAFAHSSGLEWAVEAGHVHDRATTAEWITTLIEHGPLRNDVVLFVHA